MGDLARRKSCPARAARGDERDPARHQPVHQRRRARAGSDRRRRHAALRGSSGRSISGTGSASRSSHRVLPAPARGEMQRGHQRRMTREESSMIRCVEECVVINIGDALGPDAPPFTRQVAQAGSYRSLLLVPMMRAQRCIGVIGVSRESVGRFTAAQVDLLRTFASQSVFAIPKRPSVPRDRGEEPPAGRSEQAQVRSSSPT